MAEMIEVEDPVFTLNWLFVGGPAPACPKSADADDSGRVDISDAIFSLGCKFLGDSCPPSHFPECGPDLTADDLDCASFSVCP